MANKQAQNLLSILKDKKKLDVDFLSATDSPCVVAEWISTGCLVLDRIMGGGIPVGRIVEFYGDPSSGKSLIAAYIAAYAQANGCIVAYADTEAAVSLDIMRMVGVDVESLIYGTPDTVEDVFSFFQETIDAKVATAKDSTLVLIWDSIAATSVQFEQDAEYGKATMGRHAAIISQALRKITKQFARNRVAAVFLNQTRENIGVMWGDKETTFGGKAVSFHSSVRVKLDLSTKLVVAGKRGKKIIGMNTTATVVKNKVAVPFQQATLPIYFKSGVNDAEATLTFLKSVGIVTVAGAWHKIIIGEEEFSFQKREWKKVYDDHYSAIVDMVMEADADVLEGDEAE